MKVVRFLQQELVNVAQEDDAVQNVSDKKQRATLHKSKTMRWSEYMPDSDTVYNTKNVADMHYLFTNDKLQKESPAIVFQCDPFCIPRVTDNVSDYRPTLNPLSIFLREDPLVPRNLRLDPTETLPSGEDTVVSTNKAVKEVLLPSSESLSSSTSSERQYKGKASAFMGTMPRQVDYTKNLVAEKRCQNHEIYRILPSLSWVSSYSRQVTNNSEEDQNLTHMFDTMNGSLAVADSTISLIDSDLDIVPSILPSKSVNSRCEIEPLQPLDSTADALTDNLAIRNVNVCSLKEKQWHFQIESFDPVGEMNGYAIDSSIPSNVYDSNTTVENKARDLYTDQIISRADSASEKQDISTFLSVVGATSLSTSKGSTFEMHSGLITCQRNMTRAGLNGRIKKARHKNVLRICSITGCSKGARGKSGLCQKHGGGKRCATPNCPKGAQGSSTMCLFHGGGYRCTIEGCTTGARGTSGLCARHGGHKKRMTGITVKRGAYDRDIAMN
ncbi:hypothetical protein Plhal304r1_c025g0084871 [Plasmopara halstedii]